MRRAFADRVAPVEGEIKERLVGVGSDDSDSEDESGEEGGEGEGKGQSKGGDGWESMDED